MRPELGAGIGIGISIGISGQGVSRGNDYVLYDNFNTPNKLSYKNDFSALPIPVFEDNFNNRSDPAPWIPDLATGTSIAIVNEALRVTDNVDDGTQSRAVLNRTYNADDWYRLRGTMVATTTGPGTVAISPNTSVSGAIDSQVVNIGETADIIFQAIQSSLNALVLTGPSLDDTSDYDNILIDEIPALDSWFPDDSTGSKLSILNEQLEVKKGDASVGNARAILPLNYTVNNWSRFLITRKFGDTTPGAISVAISPDNTVGNSIINTALNPGETADLYFQATQITLNVVTLTGAVENETTFYDDVIIEEVPALDGWTAGNDAIVSVNNGVVTIENGSALEAYISHPVALSVANYNIAVNGVTKAPAGSYSIGTAPGTYDIKNNALVDGDNLLSFNSASAATRYTQIRTSSVTAGESVSFDLHAIQQTLVENGTFDGDTAWTKGTGWTIAGGVASCDGTQGVGGSVLDQVSTSVVAAATYSFEITVSNIAGGFVTPVLLGTTPNAGDAISTNGTYVVSIIAPAGASGFRVFADPDFIGDIDNVIVTELY